MKTFINYCEEQQINEGFWQWLLNLIKSLFEDDPDISLKTQTKAIAATRLLHDIIPNNSTLTPKGEQITRYEIDNETQRILKEKSSTDFINHLESFGNKLLLNNVYDEKKLITWKLTTLYMGIMLATDKKRKQDADILQKHYDNIAKEHRDIEKDVLKYLRQHENNVEHSNDSAIPYSTKELYNVHKGIIKTLLSSNNITIDMDTNVLGPVNTICTKKSIMSPDLYYALILVRIGKEIINNEELTGQFVKKFYKEQQK